MDCDLVAGLSEDAFKVERYFPTLVFSLQVPGSELLNAHLIEAIYAEQERDRTGVRKSNFPRIGRVAQPCQAAQGRHVCGIGSKCRCGRSHDVPRARISQVLPD